MRNYLNCCAPLTDASYNQCQLTGLVVMRVLIGWHFLYEGIAKLLNPYWSSAAYLLESKWIISGLATTIVANPTLLTMVDNINMWGLTLIGLALMLGIVERPAALVGMTLVLLYYLFMPPFVGFEYSRPAEGSYIIVNKNLIEAAALFVVACFPSGGIIGIDKFLFSKNETDREGSS